MRHGRSVVHTVLALAGIYGFSESDLPGGFPKFQLLVEMKNG